MKTYRLETLSQFTSDAIPLLREHWYEIAAHKDIPLEPDFERYEALEAAGVLRVYTARYGMVLIGYAVFTVTPHIHYQTSLQASEDVIFVATKHRRGRVGIELLKFCDTQLAAEGVQIVHHHVKLAHPALGIILQRMGYSPVETIFSKRLDK